MVYILANATEKTQQPFIKRALRLYDNVHQKVDSSKYIQATLRNLIRQIVCMTDYLKAKLLLDYMEQILPPNTDEDGIDIGLQSDLEWHSKNQTFYTNINNSVSYFEEAKGKDDIIKLSIYRQVDSFEEDKNFVGAIIQYMYIQLVKDVLNNRAMNEHIAPAIKKLQSIKPDVEKIFVVSDDIKFWGDKNFVVIDLNKTNINMKKLVPLIVSSKLYNSHKMEFNGNSSLNIIVDEAHNILSYESTRESESWKDFRLETFEEIIKEGRKFGVFLTIASQRPSDISSTIISQLHNYLIHRLINNKDLDMIEKAISYLDKLSIESLPILPVGACVLSGVMAYLPVTIQIDAIESEFKPTSDNISLQGIWIDDDSSQQV